MRFESDVVRDRRGQCRSCPDAQAERRVAAALHPWCQLPVGIIPLAPLVVFNPATWSATRGLIAWYGGWPLGQSAR